MKIIYRGIETGFEKVASTATIVLGNSITFIIAVCMVLFFLISKEFYMQDMHKMIGDMIMSMTFLALFIIQKLVNVESKTEHEVIELAKEYTELAEQIREEEALVEHTNIGETPVAIKMESEAPKKII
jgi:uncharacterized membrane protein